MTQVSIRRPRDMTDIDKMVALGELMANEGAYHSIPYSVDKTRTLGAYLLADEEEETYFARLVEQDDRVIGMFIGSISEYYFSKGKIASDMLLYMHPDYRKGTAPVRMVKAFMKWAKDHNALEVCMGVTAGINNEAVYKLYGLLGMEHVGHIYKARIV